MKATLLRSLKRDGLRLLALLAVASLLAVVTNALLAQPVPLFSPDGPGAWPERSPRISVDDLAAGIRDHRAILILDVRSEEAFSAGHPLAAQNVPYDRFAFHFSRLNLNSLVKAAEIVVLLCESAECPSADRAARILKESGHSNLRVLEGGWAAYLASGLERSR